MKRIGALLLSLCMILTAVTVLISCGDDTTTTTTGTKTTTTTTPKVTTTLPKITTSSTETPDPDEPDPNVIEISNATELLAALTATGESYAGKTLKLTADIELNDTSAPNWYEGNDLVEWPSMGIFAGTFDGNGHSITGVYMNYGTINSREEMDAAKANGVGNKFYGMFEQPSGATFKNLAIVDAYMYVKLAPEAAPEGESNILSGTSWKAHHAGLLVGCANNGLTIDNCYFDAKLDLVNVINVGFIFGYANGTVNMSNCIATGEMTAMKGGTVYNGGTGNFTNILSAVKFTLLYEDALAEAVTANNWIVSTGLFGAHASANISGMFGISTLFDEDLIDPATSLPYVNTTNPDKIVNSGCYETSAFIGEAAKATMTGEGLDSTAPFDWDNVWQTNANALPSLRLFPDLVPTVPAA